MNNGIIYSRDKVTLSQLCPRLCPRQKPNSSCANTAVGTKGQSFTPNKLIFTRPKKGPGDDTKPLDETQKKKLQSLGQTLSHCTENQALQGLGDRTTAMREKQLEQMFVSTVRRHGGLALKLTSPSQAGLPDRLVLLPGGKLGFVELKAPGKHLRPIQQHRHNQLHALGFFVTTLDNPNHIQDTIHAIQTT